jgi:NAD(P)-dependent dehydrogenase (short-subunit alcohol dehydrogenase family)
MKSINQLINLNGRRALITGANGHLGQHLAITIAELGGNLTLVDLHESINTKLCSKLNKNFDIQFEYIQCNIENENERADLISKISMDSQPLNIVINNAAFVGTSKLKGWTSSFEDQSIETWRSAIEVNLTSVFDLSKGLTSKILSSKHGSIVNIGSTYGVVGPNYSLYENTDMGNPAAYAASKGGLVQLTRWLATTLGPEIRVNTISPGGIFREQSKEFVRRYEERTPLKRMASEEDFKGAIAFLSSDLSSYVTGQNILVDGGWTIW